MSIGAYRQLKPREEFMQHRIIRNLDKRVKDLETENSRLRNRLKRQANSERLVLESQSRTFEQIRRAM